MPYPQRVEIDSQGNQTWLDIDNVWVLANKPNTLHITSDKAQIASNGVDVGTLTIQLKTPMLTDDSYQDLAQAGDVVIQVDDTEVAVTLDANGTGTHEVASVEAGTFTIRGVTYSTPTPLELEAV